MLKLFVYELFQVKSKLNLFITIFIHFISIFVISFFVFVFKNYIFTDVALFIYKLFFFLVSYVSSCLVEYNFQKINLDVCIYKSKVYKVLFLICSILISLPSRIFISGLISRVNVCSLDFFEYAILICSIILKKSYPKNYILNIVLLVIGLVISYFSNIYIDLGLLFVYLIFCLILFNKCYDEYNSLLVNSNLIENSYQKNTRFMVMLTDWIFIRRTKKRLLFVTLLCSFCIMGLFIYLNQKSPEIMANITNIRLLLLYGYVTGAFSIIIGPYLMNWFYYYSNDYLSKNYTIELIIKGKLDLMNIFTTILFICTGPFCFYFNINIRIMIYFFVMNLSVSSLISLLIGIAEISRIDNTKSPRLNVEKGSPFAAYLPWVCELIPVLVFKFFVRYLSISYMLIFSIIIFIFVKIINERIIQKYSALIFSKVSKR